MDYWKTLGRVVIARETAEGAERMCEYLTYSGVDATVSLESDSSLYVVTVPEDKARAAAVLIDRITLRYVTEDAATREYKENIPSFPAFEKSGSRFNYESSTAFGLIGGSGLAFLLILVINTIFFSGERTMPGIFSWILAGLGLALLISGFIVLKKANDSRRRIAAENKFTLHVMEWFISTYSSLHIDYSISAANNSRDMKMEELKSNRKQLIRSYITREFSIGDISYLNYLVDEIYAAVFEKTLSVQRAVNAGRFSRLFSLRKEHDKRNGNDREQS